MTSAGNDNHTDSGEQRLDVDNSRSPLWLVLMGVVIIACLFIGVQGFGILYSIMFPPQPPVPQNVTVIRHTPVDHGVDEWLYRTNQDACQVVRYYRLQGGECRVVEDMCADEESSTILPQSIHTSGQHVGLCSGVEQFSIFAMRWEANIATGYNFPDGATQFNLFREIFWTGSVPPKLDPRNGFQFED